MPIYEFYCEKCNTVFNFFSRTVNTTRTPSCPLCQHPSLARQLSLFSTASGRQREEGPVEGGADADLPPGMDEARMEKALNTLASEAEAIDQNDPRQAAQLMKKFSRMTGMELGSGMREALSRLESGEDPEQVEAELGGQIEAENPFQGPDGSSHPGPRRVPPKRDQTLYEL